MAVSHLAADSVCPSGRPQDWLPPLMVIPTSSAAAAKIDCTDYQWARTGALKAHATQVDPNAGWWFGLDDAQLSAAYPWEDWILARTLVGSIPEDDSERDLFAGIRESVRS